MSCFAAFDVTAANAESEAMTYATRLRLACRHARPLIPSPYHRPRCASSRLAAGPGLRPAQPGLMRFFSGDFDKGIPAERDEFEEQKSNATKSKDVDFDPFESVFKKQRRQDLAEASSGENPLFSDAWGRMEEGAKAQLAKQKERIKEAKELQEAEEELERIEEEERERDAKPKRVPIPDFLMEFHIHEGSGELVNIMGRIRAKRMSGKGLMFLDIQNEFQRVQVMVSRQAVLQKPRADLEAQSEAEKDALQAEMDAAQAEADAARSEDIVVQAQESAAAEQDAASAAEDSLLTEEDSAQARRAAKRQAKRAAEEALDIAQNHFNMMRNMLQVGDHISVTGLPTRTKAGEQTLKATELPQLISPTMEQIPEKLTDEKTKMANRHLDMLVNQDVSDTLRLRAEITRYMREYFYSKRFLEYQTPILAQNAGGAVARPFTTRATEFKDKELAMRVAPELWLKRLVVGGVDKVFEIGPSFRNEGIDATHNPEFTMCEFYSAYSNLPELIKETEELICGLAEKSHELIKEQLTALPPLDLSKFQRPFKQVEFVPGLEAALGIRLPRLTTIGALPELLAVLKLAGISLPGEAPNTLPRLLDRLAAMYLEPLSFNEPLFITNHPACMSPLSKSYLCPKTYQLVSARAELFMGGRELANMYEEENNPREQRKKLAEHRQLVNTAEGSVALESPDEGLERYDEEGFAEQELFSEVAEEDEAEESQIETDDHGEASPLDQSFIKALDYGLPPTGGWGCGVERLVMLFSGAQRISDVLSFGTLRNVVGLTAQEEVNSIRSEAAPEKPVEVKESRSAAKRRLKAERIAAAQAAQAEGKSRFSDAPQAAPTGGSNRFGGPQATNTSDGSWASESSHTNMSPEEFEKLEEKSSAPAAPEVAKKKKYGKK